MAAQKVSEIYSPPRITKMAKMRPSLNIEGLRAFDLSTAHPGGGSWDFNKKEHRDLARRMCADDDLDWIIGSPPCTDFSVLGRWKHKRMKAEYVRRRLREARRHQEFCVVHYRDQLARGLHFLHEHPLGVSSWKEGCIEVLAGKPGVSTVVGHMFRYDLKVDDELGVKQFVMKPTRGLSSREAMLRRLSPKCLRDHEHGSLFNGKAAQAAIYLDRICVEILKGMRDTTIENDVNQ